MTWFALTTEPNKVRSVRKALRRRGHQAYVAAIVQTRTVAKAGKGKRRRHITVLMPYVLVKAPESPYVANLWLYDVMATKGARGFIGDAYGPSAIQQGEIDDVKSEVARCLFEIEVQRHKRWLKPGSKAAIKDGSLAGRAGTVQWVSKKQVGLETMLFGSKRVVVVGREQLEAA